MNSLNIQLDDLKNVLEEAINKGSPIEEVSKIYEQIKDLETLIKRKAHEDDAKRLQ